jgi:hypothetical protein
MECFRPEVADLNLFDEEQDPDSKPHQVRSRIRIRIKAKRDIRIRISIIVFWVRNTETQN